MTQKILDRGNNSISCSKNETGINGRKRRNSTIKKETISKNLSATVHRSKSHRVAQNLNMVDQRISQYIYLSIQSLTKMFGKSTIYILVKLSK